MKLKYLPIACALCAALLLGSCGGDSDGDATASEQVPPEIEKAVNDGLVKGKYSAAAGEVESLEIDGDEATAEVKMAEGTLDEQTVEVILVRDKKGWKLEELAQFSELDKPRMVKNYEAETKSIRSENLSPALIRCLTREFSNSSQETIEAMYLDKDKSVFLELGKRCTEKVV